MIFGRKKRNAQEEAVETVEEASVDEEAPEAEAAVDAPELSEAEAQARAWEGARGLEWTVPSPAPHHTFTVPPVIREGDLAHSDINH